MKCFRNGVMILNKWKRNNCTGKEVELWLSVKSTCDFQLLLLKNKSGLWIYILSKGIVVCTILKEQGLCYSFSVLHPAWFPSCARFNGVEKKRKGFFCRGDFVACADPAAQSAHPPPPFVLYLTGMIIGLHSPIFFL